ncbi:DeoR/GlpR family DNA-binding transcription regulator [Bacillus sp. FJAT-49736]|uniref:DeoR/GlpR family DNA-binding transcription regulator n=1 Tax=Bacillus sp. FJAT-49736 TaxID=2833582 RepID=UPI001BCA4E1C|nr:DeoR/GlpR family DNA-binding transcription regulator [Bacillus sp. FJAT-49736]MBS4172269.1 DeoR/GlpR transcriptional regulator [Bacillus sp. FJAT-49736]
MLTAERHRIILELLKQKEIVSLQELVNETNTSESTIRRDLIELEKKNALKRVHGGAARLQGKLEEPGIIEKTAKNLTAKDLIAKYAASLVEQADCIYLDAGSTTLQMIPYLPNESDIVVVTNGLTNIQPLLNKGIKTYLIGGAIKPKTGAMIGRGALYAIENYRFDKCFLGVNGIHPSFGYTTPDPEEAFIKQKALQLSRESYVLADDTKFGEIAFSEIAPLSEASIITNLLNNDTAELYKHKTTIKVVTS